MASVTPPVPRGPRGKGVTGGGQFAGRNRNHKQSGNSSALSGDARAIMAQLAQLLPPTSATVGTTATGAAEGGGGRS